ncbi:MAG TPA: hypothetical protein VEA78_06690, partial [Acidimicrobiales bacterium]|nr:hypothetical protein [Acidimicrobiales bacterium]
MPSRDQQLLDAAIEVLASGGPRQLTHRAVDTAAGVPLGSTSNCFRTRDALLVGVLRRVLERDVAAWQALVPERVATVDDLADGLGHLVSDQVGAHRS